MAAQPYQYRPLGTTGNPIRLLTLLPGTWNDKIACTLHHADLDTKPSYRALSYTWGDANDTIDILLHDAPFKVTRNLEIALRYLRARLTEREPAILWVDSLCINQSDIHERAAQVRKMAGPAGCIFSSAEQVIAWTGEPDDDSRAAFPLLQDISKRIRYLDWAKYKFSAEKMYLDGEDTFDLTLKTWRPLLTFLSRAYFTRVWMIPELAAGTRLVLESEPPNENACIILCGFDEVPFDSIDQANSLRANAYFADPNPLESVAYFRCPAFYMSEAVRNVLHKGPLWQLVRDASALEATDPHDKVYALVSVADEKYRHFPVDYGKPVDELWRELFEYCTERAQNLFMLEGEIRFRPTTNTSWAQHIVTNKRFSHLDYWPAGKTAMHMHIDRARGLLFVKGVHVGTIVKLLGPITPRTTLGKEHTERQLRSFAQGLSTEQHEALCRTMSVDKEISFKEPGMPWLRLRGSIVQARLQWLGLKQTSEQDMSGGRDERPQISDQDVTEIYSTIGGRCVFVLDTGYVGLGPYHAQLGDSVAVIYGARTCIMLGPDGTEYTHVGGCYVQGVMDGELVRDVDGDGMPIGTRNFVIR